MIGTGGAATAFAAAGKPLGPSGQRAQRVGAALAEGSRVLLADIVGHLGEAPVERGGIGGVHPAPQGGGARLVICLVDDQFAAANGVMGAPQCARVVVIHHSVDGLCRLGRR